MPMALYAWKLVELRERVGETAAERRLHVRVLSAVQQPQRWVLVDAEAGRVEHEASLELHGVANGAVADLQAAGVADSVGVALEDRVEVLAPEVAVLAL